MKSAILLAGLYAEGETSVTEPVVSRNHTELMLRYFGAEVRFRRHHGHHPAGGRTLSAAKVAVPGDISSAAYFIAAAL